MRPRTRARDRRREETYGDVPNPLYWPCPECLAAPRQNCRTREPLPQNFHPARIDATHGDRLPSAQLTRPERAARSLPLAVQARQLADRYGLALDVALAIVALRAGQPSSSSA
jgi:hypothetical protein